MLAPVPAGRTKISQMGPNSSSVFIDILLEIFLTDENDVEKRQMKLQKYLFYHQILLFCYMAGRLHTENQDFLRKWKPGGSANDVCFDIVRISAFM